MQNHRCLSNILTIEAVAKQRNGISAEMNEKSKTDGRRR